VKLNLQALESKLPAKSLPPLAESQAIVEPGLAAGSQPVAGICVPPYSMTWAWLRPCAGTSIAWRRRAGIVMEFRNESPGETLVSVARDKPAFVFAQEALTNVTRHARAKTRFFVQIRQQRGWSPFLAIEDDGIGFDPDHATPESDRRRQPSVF